MLNRKEFEKIQKKTGFNLDLLEKTYHLTRTLNELQQNNLLQDLTLKGGTALNFIYLKLPRLSIDLDFNFTKTIEKEAMTNQRKHIENKLQMIASTLGYTIKERGSSYIISRNTFQYTTIRNTKDHVKIEINYLHRLPLENTQAMHFPSIFPDIPAFTVPAYSLEELTAQKIIACIMRSEPRDIYDLYLLSKHKLSKGKLQNFTAIYYCMYATTSKPDMTAIKHVDLKSIDQELRQFIRGSAKLDSKIIQKEAADFIERTISFSKKQQQFIDTFYNEKKIKPEFISKNMLQLKHHPALLHKLNTLEKT